MRYLPIIALVGLTLAAGPVLAQQGNSTSNGASGTTGDLNAPPSGSASDVNSSGTNSGPAPGVSAPAPMAQEPAAEQPPMAQKPMAHHKHPTHHATTQHAATTHHATGHHAKMASRGNGPCFPLAMQFDKKLSGMMSSQSQAQHIQQATDMRNKGMEACNSGNVKGGEDQIRQAIAGL